MNPFKRAPIQNGLPHSLSPRQRAGNGSVATGLATGA
jgi:hypothetical protein